MAGHAALNASRRRLLAAAGALPLALRLQPARADAAELRAAIAQWTGGAPMREGRVTLDLPPLVENGNVVPLTVRVESPMTPADHVQAIAIFSELNPQRDVARFTLTPAMGRAQVATRIRLATSQQVVALARMADGSLWSQRADVIVTLAACVES
jgi:sulfur-oxidizing protein SoxY